jgi:hypothetical protein
VYTTARVTRIRGAPLAPPLTLTLDAAASLLAPGDVVEPLDAMPSSVAIEGCEFANSRASGIVAESNNVVVEGNVLSNLSSAAIASGPYYASFGESPFGSGLSFRNNTISNANRGHRTTAGGQWGGGAAMNVAGGSAAATNATDLHSHVELRGNSIEAGAGAVVSVAATAGVVIAENVWRQNVRAAAPVQLRACSNVTMAGNECCDRSGANCEPCPCGGERC